MDQYDREIRKAVSPCPRTVPCVRASALAPFVDFCLEQGAPFELWGQRLGLPMHQLGHPDNLLPLHLCYRLLDLIASETQQRELGPVVAARVSPFNLGSLGTALRTTTTVLEYVQIGTRLITSHSNSGIRLWYAREGAHVRISQVVEPGPGLGPAITDSYTLAVTLNTLRSFFGASWSPLEIRLRRGAGDVEAFAASWPGAVIIEDAPCSSLTLPLALLDRPILPPGRSARGAPAAPSVPLPASFTESIEQLIAMLLYEGSADIGAVAGAAGLSVRALQRRLESEGTSFRCVLSRVRTERARLLLATTSLPVAAIASELGYTDASNFARAFTRENLLSPTAFRSTALAP
jgi:AraC-like DNA-binding protein